MEKSDLLYVRWEGEMEQPLRPNMGIHQKGKHSHYMILQCHICMCTQRLGNTVSNRYLCAQSSKQRSSQQLKGKSSPDICGLRDKQNVVFTYSGVVVSLKK